MTPPIKEFSHRGWLGVAALVIVLLAVSFIPPQSIGGIKLRRANILSDLMNFDDSGADGSSSSLFDEEEFRIDLSQVAERIEADTAIRPIQTTFSWKLPGHRAGRTEISPDTMQLMEVLIPIEDFDTAGRFKAFCDTLLNVRRPVRIAILGDSFIEADILTADLREKLQQSYGGSGAGFAPMASPLTAYRRTIKTQSKGWSSYNIMQRRAAPQQARDNFYVSGWVCQPTPGAHTRWENTSARERLDTCSAARIFFISPRDSRVAVVLNDTLRHEFSIDGDEAVRQLTVEAPRIRSLEFHVLSGVEGFIGYGAVFESDGMVIDNYSVRSNNGQAMFWTNPSVNAQINAMLGYDLVVLQYGLNIMQQGVRNYSSYTNQIEKMVGFVRQCFPGAAMLILSVSDRAVKTDSGIAQMDAVPHMVSSQRQAAQRTGTAFWSTADAMLAQGGMVRFVANGWAGKDFTHINYAGGRRIAWSLADALNSYVAKSPAAYNQRLKRLAKPDIIDTMQQRRISHKLQAAIIPFFNPKRQ